MGRWCRYLCGLALPAWFAPAPVPACPPCGRPSRFLIPPRSPSNETFFFCPPRVHTRLWEPLGGGAESRSSASKRIVRRPVCTMLSCMAPYHGHSKLPSCRRHDWCEYANCHRRFCDPWSQRAKYSKTNGPTEFRLRLWLRRVPGD